MSKLYVGSEVGKLKRVILHSPNLSIARLTPSNCDDLLFDDVLRVHQASEEHEFFQKTLASHDIEVLLLANLLTETLSNHDAKKWIIDQQVSDFRFGPNIGEIVREFLNSLPDRELSRHLTGGTTVSDIDSNLTKYTNNSLYGHDLSETSFLIKPLPNHLFTRDTSCWVYNGVSVNPMTKTARKRETVHLKAIYRFHPLFQDKDFEYWYGNDDVRSYEGATIEGGDVEVIGNGKVLIGISERTTPQGIEMLARGLFEKGAANEIVAVDLGKSRAAMHLDTVLTMLDRDAFTYYPGVVDDDNRHFSITPGDNGEIVVQEKKGFFKTLGELTGTQDLRLISTGGFDAFSAEREQWNDANNVLTLRPGVVCGYERNHHTIEKMEKAGINVIPIKGEELGRGRGGARCMSCPIERED